VGFWFFYYYFFLSNLACSLLPSSKVKTKALITTSPVIQQAHPKSLMAALVNLSSAQPFFPIT